MRKLAEPCEFNAATLDEMLRDRLVLGVAAPSIQKALLNERDQSFASMYRKAIALESTIKEMKDMTKTEQSKKTEQSENSSDHGEVHKLRHQPTREQQYSKQNRKSNYASKPKYDKSSDKSSGSSATKFNSGSTDSREKCYRCGRNHNPNKCWYKKAKCNNCKRIGHIDRACRNKSGENHFVNVESDDEYEYDHDVLNVNNVKNVKKVAPYCTNLCVNGTNLKMEIDTGSSVSLISHKTYQEKFAESPLQSTGDTLNVYGGTSSLNVVGKVPVCVNDVNNLMLFVVQEDGPSLVGRDWLDHVKLDWSSIFNVHKIKTNHEVDRQIENLLEDYQELFTDEIGKLQSHEAKLVLNADAVPKFVKSRTVPYALKAKVRDEIDRLEQSDIIKKVDFAEWASPIVPVVKDNGEIRICADFKVTINKFMNIDRYPLPTPEDLFNKLAQGQSFSKLDLSHAYNQIPLDEESQKIAVINTEQGLYALGWSKKMKVQLYIGAPSQIVRFTN